jgi:uncharacterized membrane protein YfcA
VEIIAGFLIALAIGLTGVGAGSITAPVLILFFHQSTSDAVTTALVFGTVVKLIATPFYLARGQVNFKILGFLVLGGLPAVLAGSLLLGMMDKSALTGPVLLIVGITVVISAAATLWRTFANHQVHKPLALKWIPWVVAPIGLEVGFSSAGAGALGTVFLMRFTSLLPSEVVGTDLAFGLVLSLFGGGVHASMSGVPWAMLGKLLIGGIPAVFIGSQLATVLSQRKMRMALCVWLIYIGGQLSYRSLTTPAPSKANAAAHVSVDPPRAKRN